MICFSFKFFPKEGPQRFSKRRIKKEKVWSEWLENGNDDLGADQTNIEQRPIASDEMKIGRYRVQNFGTVLKLKWWEYDNDYRSEYGEKMRIIMLVHTRPPSSQRPVTFDEMKR